MDKIKPDVASVGVSAVLETSGRDNWQWQRNLVCMPQYGGTCYLSLARAFLRLSNMKIRSAFVAICKQGPISPDDRMGYGIP